MSNDIMAKLEIWRRKIEGCAGQNLPHANNILHKLKLPNARTQKWIDAFGTLIPRYLQFRTATIDKRNLQDPYQNLVLRLNRYLDILRSPRCSKVFSPQSDFASSVIPEFFYILLNGIVQSRGMEYEVSAQKDLVVECLFDSLDNGRLIFKKKRVDVAVLQPASLEFNDKVQNDFSIPVVAMEVKTNVDKNMISGIEHAVESLKRTFPRCLYFAVAEFADFALEKQNYATTEIEEIIILRKQKRSNVRRGATAQGVDLDIVNWLAKRVIKHLELSSGATSSLSDRMSKGFLIRG